MKILHIGLARREGVEDPPRHDEHAKQASRISSGSRTRKIVDAVLIAGMTLRLRHTIARNRKRW